MNKNILTLLVCVFFSACSNIEFVYKETEFQKQLFNKTNIILKGDNIPFLNSIVVSRFGSPINQKFDLEVYVSEKKTKASIKENQVSSRVDYEIAFNYQLINKNKECIIYVNDQYSRFSFMPKAEGYNFGSDKSLESLYKRNIRNNIDSFIGGLEDKNLYGLKKKIENKKCVNEN